MSREAISMLVKSLLRATKKEKGSLVLEGVVVIPAIIILLVGFMLFIRVFSTEVELRQRMESLSLEISNYYYTVEMLSARIVEGIPLQGIINQDEGIFKERILSGSTLDKDDLTVGIEISEDYVVITCYYELDFLLGQRYHLVERNKRRLWTL